MGYLNGEVGVWGETPPEKKQSWGGGGLGQSSEPRLGCPKNQLEKQAVWGETKRPEEGNSKGEG